MVFANSCSVVASLLKVNGKGSYCVECPEVMVIVNMSVVPYCMAVHSSQYCRTASAAACTGAKGIGEADPLRCQPVKVGSPDHLVTITPQCISPVIISNKQDKVWLRLTGLAGFISRMILATEQEQRDAGEGYYTVFMIHLSVFTITAPWEQFQSPCHLS